MKGRRGQQSTVVTFLSRHRRVALLVAVLVVFLAGLVVYDYISVNLWLDHDAGRFETYPVRLIENSADVAPDAGNPHAGLDRLLIEEMRKGKRNVATMSRSEVKYHLFNRRAVVKVFLETAAPNDPSLRSRLTLVCRLKRNDGQWRLAKPPEEKTLE